ncbi:hypothetical protein KAW18_18460 [candidate division WOR-3 bacterium]|nr:hypothetical protein [candidate division WOR-3 bacterium]
MALEYTTWNPEDKHADINLSNGNLTATSVSNSSRGVRSVFGVSEGKWYWEITPGTLDPNWSGLGVGNSSAILAGRVGGDANGYAYVPDGKKRYSGIAVAYGNSYVNGDVIGVALDMNAGKIWWSKNGVWQASGDPAAGTNEAYSGISGTFYAMVSMDGSGHSFIANFGASALSYSVPNGFNPGLYSGTLITFTFTNPIPAHLSTTYGTTEQLQLTTTINGEEESYTYDATFYNGSDVQIGSTISGVNSGTSATSNAYLSTPSGIDYSWYVIATSDGSEDTSSTYTFSNRFLYEGYVTENGDPVSRIVRLYYRDTGELIDSTTSSGGNGYYSLDTTANDEHFIIAFDDEAGEDYNSLILDRLLPNEE